MYKSPIEIELNDIVSDAVEKADEYIVRFVQQVVVNVDKDELIKALEYDRGQYEKGWNDRDNEIVRCKDCKNRCTIYCPMSQSEEDGTWTDPNEDCDYCSWGERKDADE